MISKILVPTDGLTSATKPIELIYSREWRGWRVYGGGEYLIHKEPCDLKPMSGHWGGEYCGTKPLVWKGRPIVGVEASRSIAGPSIPASRPASSSVIPTRGSVACASWPSGTRGLIRAASFTTIRLNTMAWGCRLDSEFLSFYFLLLSSQFSERDVLL